MENVRVSLRSCMVIGVLLATATAGRKTRQDSCMRKWLKASGIHNLTTDYEEKLLVLQLDETNLDKPLAQRVLTFVFSERSHQQQFLKCISRQTERCHRHPSCQDSGICLYNTTSASFTCKCPNTSFGMFCEKDVDECQLGLHKCSSKTSKCINIIGGYACQCLPGFQKQGDKCEDINECTSNPSPCAKTTVTCKNLQNDFQCMCRPGYTGRRCDQDLDECLSSPCQNGGTCYNKANHFTCKCPIEFEGVTCQKRWFSSAMFRSILRKLDNLSAEVPKMFKEVREKISGFQHNSDEQYLTLFLNDLTRGPLTCHHLPKRTLLPRLQKYQNTTSHVSVTAYINPAKVGRIAPFPVKCVWNETAKVFMTVVHHNQENRTRVRGYEGTGSYSAKLEYGASIAQVSALVDASANCKQFVKYECYDSTLAYGYWKDRAGRIVKKWSSGRLTHLGSHSCESGRKCECDKNDDVRREDKAYITDKKHLPITAVHFGDTGDTNEVGFHTVGPLMCTN